MLQTDHEFVIVDDDSPDETWKVAEELSEEYPVKPVRRTSEKGLATAVLRGFRESQGDTIVVMDGDLQHPPEKVPELIESIDSGNDIAIGSRFVDGGSNDGLDSIFRDLVSKGADFLAKLLFRKVRDIKDLQSGFFAVRRDVVEDREFNPVGYKILLEILVVVDDELKIEEVPYEFRERSLGESNLGIDSIIKYVLHLGSLSWRKGELVRLLKFGLVGVIGTLVNLGAFYILNQRLHYLIAGAGAIELSILSNFFLNRHWTFQDIEIKGLRSLGTALGRDHLVRSGGAAINLLILWTLTSFLGILPLLSQAIGVVAGFSWNYIGNKWWTWEVKK